MESLELKGKVIIEGKIKAVTGLHIGGKESTLEIGGVENVVIRDPITNKPYIPGSSLKGKMRSLLEKALNKPLEVVKKGSFGKPDIRIHRCKERENYEKNGKRCEVCRIFGLPSEKGFAEPTRIQVRDAFLLEEVEIDGEKRKWKDIKTDLPYSEIKWENVIDRITSAADPRQIERVPAGALFKLEIIYDIYDEEDRENLKLVLKSLKLLEDDYLGGSGSRGSGKIEFKDLQVYWKGMNWYKKPDEIKPINSTEELKRMIESFDSIIKEKILI